MDIFSFLAGVFLLFKGEFRLGNRYISKLKSRQIALLLMLPMVVGVMAAMLFVPTAVGDSTMLPDGTVSLDDAALEGTLNLLLVVSLITFGGVMAAIAYIVYSIPPGEQPTTHNAPSSRTVIQPPPAMWSRPVQDAPPAARPAKEDPFADDPVLHPQQPHPQQPHPQQSHPQPEAIPQPPPRPQPQRLHPLEGGGFAPAGYRPGRPANKPAPGQPRSIMTVAEAAAYLKLTEAQVEGLIEQGRLAAARNNGQYRIAKLAADDYLEDQKTQE